MPEFKDYMGLSPKILSYIFSRKTGRLRTLPLSLTVSITNVCNSKCHTCNIWKLSPDDQDRSKESELELWEFEKIFKGIGRNIFWITLSGGEPLIRSDVVEIVQIIKEHIDPKILIIPTNGIASRSILKRSERILEIMKDSSVIINLSLDGVDNRHDEIRGVKGNFERTMETYNGLRQLKGQHEGLEVGIHSVVSRFNVHEIKELYAWVKENLNPDSYICEIAENREELFNKEDRISPEVEDYADVIYTIREDLMKEIKNLRGVPRMIQAFRIEYYDMVVRQLREKQEILPCYAGIASGQISPYGDVWPCCIKAYAWSMGNLRDFDYDFKRIWHSKDAARIRKMIKREGCFCPMANVHYTNIICSPTKLSRIILGRVL
jgi:MoaA/NifB/PqqE/SkfB family radical SAM enzyme